MIRSTCWIILGSISFLAVGSCARTPDDARLKGPPASLGAGTVYAYADLDDGKAPVALGVAFTSDMLESLPQHPNKTSRCFDLDGDGVIADMGECDGDEERILWMPDDISTRSDIPFKYVMLNWNPMGHPEPAPPSWDEPHFDFHFYIQPLEEVEAMRAGPCGFFLNCEDFERASQPVPAKYVHANQIDVGAAVPRMGNHLINSKSPEIVDITREFTHTWIIGAYDGRVTFWEPMITRAYIASRPNACVPIEQPEAFELAAYYPTKYCVNYTEADDTHTVSLEGFVMREAG